MACLELGPQKDEARAVIPNEEKLEGMDLRGRALCYVEQLDRDWRRAVAFARESPFWAFRTTQQQVSSYEKDLDFDCLSRQNN